MGYNPAYAVDAPKRAEIDALPGLALLEFGVDWCPHCQRAQPVIEEALQAHPELPHIKIEDGAGRRLGRSFRVKQWPTLILLRDGQELGRLVRPSASGDLGELLALAAAT